MKIIDFLLTTPVFRASSFSPLSREDIEFLYRADSGTYQDSAGTTPSSQGDPIGYVTDQSGNDKHITQSTTAAKPTLGLSGDKSAIVFNADDVLINATPTAMNQPMTYYLIATQSTLGIAVLFSSGQETPVDNRNLFMGWNDNDLFVYAGSSRFSDGSIHDTNEHIYSLVFNGASSILRRDGIVIATGSDNWGALNSDGLISLGGIADNASFRIIGNVRLWAGFSNADDTEILEQMEAWLATQ